MTTVYTHTFEVAMNGVRLEGELCIQSSRCSVHFTDDIPEMTTKQHQAVLNLLRAVQGLGNTLHSVEVREV